MEIWYLRSIISQVSVSRLSGGDLLTALLGAQDIHYRSLAKSPDNQRPWSHVLPFEDCLDTLIDYGLCCRRWRCCWSFPRSYGEWLRGCDRPKIGRSLSKCWLGPRYFSFGENRERIKAKFHCQGQFHVSFLFYYLLFIRRCYSTISIFRPDIWNVWSKMFWDPPSSLSISWTTRSLLSLGRYLVSFPCYLSFAQH